MRRRSTGEPSCGDGGNDVEGNEDEDDPDMPNGRRGIEEKCTMVKRYMDDSIPTLAIALSEHMNAAELKVLASLTKSSSPTRKAELVDHILKHLEGEGLRKVWESLDEIQKAAVAEVVHSPGTEYLSERFLAKYGRRPDFGTISKWSRDGHPTPLRFFFFFGRCGGFMPEDLKQRLKEFVPAPADAQVKSIEHLPAHFGGAEEPVPLVVRDSERPAQRELVSILRLVDAGKVSVSDKTRRPSTSTMEAITAVLDGGDYYVHQPPKDKWHDGNAGPMRAFAWPMLIQAGGLAQLSGSKLQLTKAGRKALAEPPAETLKALWLKWCSTTLLDELSRIDCVKGQTGKGTCGLTSVPERRDSIALALSECPSERWILADEFARFLRATGNAVYVTRDPWSLYIGDPQYGSFGYDDRSDYLDVRYLLCLLFEYAATLGLLDVAYVPPADARSDFSGMWGTDEMVFLSRYDGLAYVRINALGAFCLGMTDRYAPTPVVVKPVLRVLPNLEIAAIGADLEHGDRLALDSYAEKTSDVVWKLEASKLLAATEAGRSVAEIREFLTARSGAPLPDTVARLLEDVSDRCARIQDRGLARLVECADGALAALIANDSRTRKHCMRAGERHLVVPAASESAFRRGLRESGYLVAQGRAHTHAAVEDAAADVTKSAAEEA